MKLLKNNKGQNMSGLQGFIMTIVVVAVVLGIGLIVLGEFQSSVTAGTAEYNATGSIIDKLGGVPTWIGIIITVSLAFIVLGYFYTRA